MLCVCQWAYEFWRQKESTGLVSFGTAHCSHYRSDVFFPKATPSEVIPHQGHFTCNLPTCALVQRKNQEIAKRWTDFAKMPEPQEEVQASQSPHSWNAGEGTRWRTDTPEAEALTICNEYSIYLEDLVDTVGKPAKCNSFPSKQKLFSSCIATTSSVPESCSQQGRASLYRTVPPPNHLMRKGRQHFWKEHYRETSS